MKIPPLLILVVLTTAAVACGPFFPNMLLVGGDGPLLVAPVAGFRSELARMKIARSEFVARMPAEEQGHRAQTMEAEMEDLRAALARPGHAVWEPEAVIERYRGQRTALWRHLEAVDAWARASWVATTAPAVPRPVLGDLEEIGGLPGEFSDYFRGAAAWFDQRTNEARRAWRAVLERPVTERRFRSTWAAFMLARSLENEDAGRAILEYQRVRALVREGLADSAGLAVASVGWEARLELRRGNYERAIALYLEQLAAGDDSAWVSLRWTAEAALGDRNAPLRRLAGDGLSRRVVTAYLVSVGADAPDVHLDGPVKEKFLEMFSKLPRIGSNAANWHTIQPPALRWLEAVEAAGVAEVESAEQLALAAYQVGDMDRASRWVERSRTQPVSRWLQAKLRLRDGRLNDAADLLRDLSRQFPIGSDGTNLLAHTVAVPDFDGFEKQTLPRQVLGELGVLRLARRDYVEALDCLLRAGFWFDAAYVAERVLTLGELQGYVDRQWPGSASSSGAEPAGVLVQLSSDREDDEAPERALRLDVELRHLLARRLARAGRDAEARAYYPAQWLEASKVLERGRAVQRAVATPAADRARALWDAARVARESGLELLGTELDPDGAITGGAFDGIGASVVDRSTNGVLVRASGDEIARATRHAPDPDTRFHYRYVAATLAWDAARLLPDNSDETARVLCTAGSWLKARDPRVADRFYKELVRRCRRTPIGAAADRLRWFPRLDAEGRLVEDEAPSDPDAL